MFFYSRIKLPSFLVIRKYANFALKRMNIVSSHFICKKICRRIFRRRRRDLSPERGSERNPGNRVPRNYRRRNRFRDSLPECTRWNADSPHGTTPIYRRVVNSIFYCWKLHLLRKSRADGWKQYRIAALRNLFFTASFTSDGIIVKHWDVIAVYLYRHNFSNYNGNASFTFV